MYTCELLIGKYNKILNEMRIHVTLFQIKQVIRFGLLLQFVYLNVRLLYRSHYASTRSCDLPNPPLFSVVLLKL